MFGLQPRFYDADCAIDRVIADEDVHVDEMLFVLHGKVGIGYTKIGAIRSNYAHYHIGRA